MNPNPASSHDTIQDRYQRGLARLAEIDGEAGQKVIDGLANIAPDLVESTEQRACARPGATLPAFRASATMRPRGLREGSIPRSRRSHRRGCGNRGFRRELGRV